MNESKNQNRVVVKKSKSAKDKGKRGKPVNESLNVGNCIEYHI